MFGLGGGELIIVLLLALVFLGPKEIPRVATQVGRLYRQLKDSAEDLKTTVEREVREEESQKPGPGTTKP
ncbi:MAG TPA: twin-arginine translocase TatA/TatE family subunit [bacterium]|nr:twin-arginine translocase TatA/TatE family subunit [bacterium]